MIIETWGDTYDNYKTIFKYMKSTLKNILATTLLAGGIAVHAQSNIVYILADDMGP